MRISISLLATVFACSTASAEWKVTTRKDRFTDETTISAMTTSSQFGAPARIAVNCDRKTVQVNISIDGLATPLPKQYGGFEVLWRVGEGQVSKTSALPIKNSSVIAVDGADKQRKYGIKPPMSIVADMAKAPSGTIYIRIEGDDASIDTQFDVAGTSDVMRKMAKDCEYPIIEE